MPALRGLSWLGVLVTASEPPSSTSHTQPEPNWPTPAASNFSLKASKDPNAPSIAAKFGSFDAFKDQFEAAGVGQFGSGWAWLVLDGGALAITSSANQDNPISGGKTPLLGNDVWEHAYYLTYKNARPDYLKAWWNTVNWAKVAERYSSASA